MFFLEKGLLPDCLIRIGIRSRLRKKLTEERKGGEEAGKKRLLALVETLKNSPIALATAEANQQHYELPPEFFEQVLGPHLKYSAGLWENGTADLNASEKAMLERTCARAEIQDGMQILELGCGWGSLSLHLAKTFPKSIVTAVSNSRSQKQFIDAQAARQGIQNLFVITADMNTFQTNERFDRVVSVEMFEHMRNYQELLKRIAGFLNPGGKLFVHIFSHKTFAYFYDEKDPSDWMARTFFTGGIMPSDNLLYFFQNDFSIQKHWIVNGRHYEKTCRAWLKRMDENQSQILPIFKKTYGEKTAKKWWVYWRVFFMACEELFGYDDGNQWQVSHYLLEKK